jgi:hypothetical protein
LHSCTVPFGQEIPASVSLGIEYVLVASAGQEPQVSMRSVCAAVPAGHVAVLDEHEGNGTQAPASQTWFTTQSLV